MTSIDCLALVGQPMPQEPRFQQPFTLRLIIGARDAQRGGAPGCAAVRCCRSAPSARADIEAPLGLLEPGHERLVAVVGEAELRLPMRERGTGVRNELVQLTVVEPPTQRPLQDVDRLVGRLARRAFSW